MSHWVNTTHLAQVGPQELVGVEGHAGLKMDPKMVDPQIIQRLCLVGGDWNMAFIFPFHIWDNPG